MAVQRKVISGQGNGTVNTAGFPYAFIETDGPLEVSYIKNGVSYSKTFFDKDRLIVSPDITSVSLKASSNTKWSFSQQDSVPEVNQSELKVFVNESGKLSVLGDDNIQWIGKDANLSTVDITDMRVTLDALSRLFTKALSTQSVSDAARYLKMKAEFAAKYRS
ncbi:hypothetical protein MUB15_20575 [Priestia sp. OVS21]|nr:hypothetical protein [Priestia sp. OVS21]